ncbi:MAG: D-lyxose/D-mannose family sugar isomerase [Eubacteriales bacterium]|nr:D-lyxose/D-mannose family sugar isomerase [Eubacteriales bacterium]
MNRSEINNWLIWGKKLLNASNFALPAFASFTPDDWNSVDRTTIEKTMLGWDITDFGSGAFEKIGAVLFTVRNGQQCESRVGTPYAEKVILVPDGGRLPLHFHFTKTEDIINRGGGTLWLKLFNAKADRSVDYESDICVFCDGVKRYLHAGETVEIQRGNSITLTPLMYHMFGAKNGDLIAGEVSSINDDQTDNFFAEPVSRFSDIVEDEKPIHLLCNEYGSR